MNGWKEDRRQFAGSHLWTAICLLAIAGWATPACAMHITEGILPLSWAVLWFIVSAPFVYWGLQTIQARRLEEPRTLSLVALVGAAIFVVSCMPVPIPGVGSCSHPCGTGLGAIVIGPGPTIVVSAIALLLQALFLSHGGLTTLGGNVFAMAIVGSLSAYAVFRGLRALRVPVLVAAGCAGWIADWATYATTAFELASALPNGTFGGLFGTLLVAFAPTQIPLGIAEGVLTAVAYRFVLVRRPELLSWSCRLPLTVGAKG